MDPLLSEQGFRDFVLDDAPDVLCLQEVRALPEQVELDLPDYHAYWNPATKKGYSGVMALCRREPLDVRLGMGDPSTTTRDAC